ncbi:low molecular weight phosphatase family protein [Pseudokineococcus lusitanus]|uniref:Arsenate-mycothiol transferase n=1 Tax=Pseudokineococcus lusitanus TaxID=763993 RepID=A0A3N1HQL1_9ACTN|nr:low molecular weight phosphatase family protein [Pseudokineococcus lusitanus]ROP44682.1 arsenate-mycothiol transferase [Pseudokineococcus lusitanus]
MTATSVLFVCVKNGGKSQMAAGLMRKAVAETGGDVTIASAGTNAGDRLNEQSVRSLLDVGVDITDQTPRQLTPQMVDAADLVVVLGSEAHVDPAPGTTVETWETDEPSLRGVEGAERMALIREDIAARTTELAHRLTT